MSVRRMTAAAAALSSEMQVGIMQPTKKSSEPRFSAGSCASDSSLCDRAPFAQTMPSAISPASATMRLRRVASTIGGSSPARGAPRSSSTKRRMSASGLPTRTPSP